MLNPHTRSWVPNGSGKLWRGGQVTQRWDSFLSVEAQQLHETWQSPVTLWRKKGSRPLTPAGIQGAFTQGASSALGLLLQPPPRQQGRAQPGRWDLQADEPMTSMPCSGSLVVSREWGTMTETISKMHRSDRKCVLEEVPNRLSQARKQENRRTPSSQCSRCSPFLRLQDQRRKEERSLECWWRKLGKDAWVRLEGPPDKIFNKQVGTSNVPRQSLGNECFW